jgi:type II secretory pathway pseudopilin PulG
MKHKGVTLIELMITVTLIFITASAFSVLLLNLTRFYRLNLARSEIQRDARLCLSTINKSLRQAKADSIIVDQIQGEPPWSRIQFVNANDDTISYYQYQNKLYQVVNGSTSILAENLNNIRFCYPATDDPKIISISICFEKKTYETGKKAIQLSIEKVRIMN